MSRTAFVTGGTGFLGRRLVGMLCDEQWEVRVLVPRFEQGRSALDSRVSAVVGDVTDRESLRGLMEGTDVVFHLAALVASWVPDAREFFRVNVEGTHNVVAEALEAGIPRFIHTSSLSGIGVRPGEIMRETSPPGRVFGPYEASKAEAERVVATAIRERNLPGIVLIPSIIIGPGDVRNTGKFLLSFVRGELPGRFAEDSMLPVVDVDDAARAHILAYERGKVGSRYIISGQNLTWGQLLVLASEVSGTPIPSRKIGSRALWLASRASEVRARLTRTPPLLPAWLADFMLTGAAMDNSKSIEELSMAYTPIENAIDESIQWFRDEGLFVGEPPRRTPASGIARSPRDRPEPSRTPLVRP